MASFAVGVLRICSKTGTVSGRAFGASILSRSTNFSPALFNKKTIFLGSSCKARVYGPEEPEERKDEVQHWMNERYVAGALIPIIPAALAFPNIVLDMALCTGMVLHTHWRLSGVVQDYIHGAAHYFFKYLVMALSVFSLGSLAYFNYTDVGFARAVRMIYTKL